jgi:hypothetical protein
MEWVGFDGLWIRCMPTNVRNNQTFVLVKDLPVLLVAKVFLIYIQNKNRPRNGDRWKLGLWAEALVGVSLTPRYSVFTYTQSKSRVRLPL